MRCVAIALLLLSSGVLAQQQPQTLVRRLEPGAATAGGAAFSLAVHGQGFAPAAARVLWGGAPLATRWENPNLLIAEVPPARLAKAGSVEVSVALEKGATPAVSFLVNPPLAWVTAEKLQPGGEGAFYSHAITLTAGTPPFRIALAAGARLPAGLHLDSYNSLLVGYPTKTGSFVLPIDATDSGGGAARREFSLDVFGQLALQDGSLPAAVRGRAYTAQLKADGGAGQRLEWKTVAGTLPPGLKLAPATGMITGAPAEEGIFDFTAQARDALSAAATRGYRIVVRSAVRAVMPVAPIATTTGDPLFVALEAAGGDAPYRWDLVSGQLPAGISLEASALRGTPSAAGTHRAVLRVRDAGGDEATVTVEIAVGARLTQSAAPPPAADFGVAYVHQFTAAGGTPPLAWSLASGTVGDGLILDAATGRLAGSPLSAGDRRFTLRVTDAAGAAADREIVIEVRAPPDPELTIAVPPRGTPGEQVRLPIRLKQPYPLDVTAVLSLRVESLNGVDDPSAQFSTGGRTARLEFRAGATLPAADAAGIGLQFGTIAGTLVLLCRLETGSPPQNHAAATARIPVDATPPQVRSVRMTRTAAGLEVAIVSTSPTRDLRSARFSFDGAGDVDVPLDHLGASWFGDVRAIPFGGVFTYRQAFAVRGDISRLRGVSVVLRNSAGASVPVAAAAATLP